MSLAPLRKQPPFERKQDAGFAEVGETLEQAVAREVHEESNVAVDPASVAYAGSQPCAPTRTGLLLQSVSSFSHHCAQVSEELRAGPFPRSLMLAFRADAAPLEPPQSLLQASCPAQQALPARLLPRHHSRTRGHGAKAPC